jgi:hypothetical protein
LTVRGAPSCGTFGVMAHRLSCAEIVSGDCVKNVTTLSKLALGTSMAVSLVGCSCSVETSENRGGNTKDASTNTGHETHATTDAGHHDAGGNSGQVSVTLEGPEAGRVTVTVDTPDGDVVVGNEDAAAPDAGIDASGADAGRVDSADASDVGARGCASVSATCVNGDILVCSAIGEPQEVFTCPNGCDVETDECLPLQLDQDWFVHQFQLTDDSQQTEATYVFESDGLVAIQTSNPLPSAYLKNAVLENYVARGKISVATTSDDDMFGFVFGWQDAQHFYLLDWKQSDQDAPPCGFAPAGVALKLVTSDSPLDLCIDFWAGTGSDKVTPLVPPTAPGWLDNTVYDFELVVRPGDIHLTISSMDVVVVDLQSDDTTYTRGLFGFYNYSQEAVRYEFLTIEPAP